jgi:hypothetical protein
MRRPENDGRNLSGSSFALVYPDYDVYDPNPANDRAEILIPVVG